MRFPNNAKHIKKPSELKKRALYAIMLVFCIVGILVCCKFIVTLNFKTAATQKTPRFSKKQ